MLFWRGEAATARRLVAATSCSIEVYFPERRVAEPG